MNKSLIKHILLVGVIALVAVAIAARVPAIGKLIFGAGSNA
jgi:hypothetical protein